jgi:hypothetical protein
MMIVADITVVFNMIVAALGVVTTVRNHCQDSCTRFRCVNYLTLESSHNLKLQP